MSGLVPGAAVPNHLGDSPSRHIASPTNARRSSDMGAATTEFFEGLSTRGHDPLLETTSGTIGVDLTKNGKVERWRLAIDKGDLDVSHRRGATDCEIRATAALFDQIAS